VSKPARRNSLSSIDSPSLPLSGGVFLLLTAAGFSSRFGQGKKELARVEGKSVLQRALEPFLQILGLKGVVITYPEGFLKEMEEALSPEMRISLDILPFGLRFIPGGPTRQASVALGLEAIAQAGLSSSLVIDGMSVLIHDAARPWVSPHLIAAVLEKTRTTGACLPLSDLADTPKLVGDEGRVTGHPDRSSIKAAQTPQGFALIPLLEAHRRAAADAWPCTDDSSLWHRYIGSVSYVPGDRKNIKITYKEDLDMGNCGESRFRIGEGWDIHPLIEGRRLLLAGCELAHPKGEAGHSDGDVLWHAIIDALLGAAGLGDIGTHFPPSDSQWKDADSSRLARIIADKIKTEGWSIANIDSTVILERPAIKPYREKIVSSIAAGLGIDASRVSVKAKTMEGFGEIGTGEAIEARAVALLESLA